MGDHDAFWRARRARGIDQRRDGFGCDAALGVYRLVRLTDHEPRTGNVRNIKQRLGAVSRGVHRGIGGIAGRVDHDARLGMRANRVDLASAGARIEERRPGAEQTGAEKGRHLREPVLGDDHDAVSSDHAMCREQILHLTGRAEKL